MGETSFKPLEAVKKIFHENIVAKTEVTGGSWDAQANAYRVKDAESGVTTEYRVKKNAYVETGLTAKTRTYKEVADGSGVVKQVDVSFDAAKGAWVEKSAAKKALELFPTKPKIMVTLKESGEGNAKTQSLLVEPIKYKDRPRSVVYTIPMTNEPVIK